MTKRKTIPFTLSLQPDTFKIIERMKTKTFAAYINHAIREYYKLTQTTQGKLKLLRAKAKELNKQFQQVKHEINMLEDEVKDKKIKEIEELEKNE